MDIKMYNIDIEIDMHIHMRMNETIKWNFQCHWLWYYRPQITRQTYALPFGKFKIQLSTYKISPPF